MRVYNKLSKPAEDLTGKKFGKLTVLKFDGYNKVYGRSRVPYWLCKCDCGETKSIAGQTFKDGRVNSCGCLLESFRKNILPDSNRLQKTLPEGLALFNEICSNYRCSARRRNLKFSLTKEEMQFLFKSNCYYCGITPSKIRQSRHNSQTYVYNGIDRIDNDEGYITGNVVACCNMCNNAKHDLTLNEFQDWIKQLVRHNNDINKSKLQN